MTFFFVIIRELSAVNEILMDIILTLKLTEPFIKLFFNFEKEKVFWPQKYPKIKP